VAYRIQGLNDKKAEYTLVLHIVLTFSWDYLIIATVSTCLIIAIVFTATFTPKSID